MKAERVWILIFRLMWTQLWARHNIYDELRQPLHGELSHSPCYLKLSRVEPSRAKCFCWASLQRIHRATSQPTVDKYAALWDLDRRRTKVSSSCIRLSRLQVHGPICTHVPSCCIPNAIYSKRKWWLFLLSAPSDHTCSSNAQVRRRCRTHEQYLNGECGRTFFRRNMWLMLAKNYQEWRKQCHISYLACQMSVFHL